VAGVLILASPLFLPRRREFVSDVREKSAVT
jgi:hypothetical protein